MAIPHGTPCLSKRTVPGGSVPGTMKKESIGKGARSVTTVSVRTVIPGVTGVTENRFLSRSGPVIEPGWKGGCFKTPARLSGSERRVRPAAWSSVTTLTGTRFSPSGGMAVIADASVTR